MSTFETPTRRQLQKYANPLAICAFMACLLAVGVIASALAFEHIGGYQPCKLCLQQRDPWYLVIPALAMGVLSAAMGWPACLTRGVLLIGALIMAYSLVIGINHAGVEWGWWQGPDDCGAVLGGIANNTTDFLQQLQTGVPPSCDQASLRVLGLSFAGWNVIVSLLLFGFLCWVILRYDRLNAR